MALSILLLLALGGDGGVRRRARTEEQGFPSTGPLSGYMDFHFNKPDREPGVIDFHRFVLLISHSFTSRLRFVGELEVEHAFVEGLEESGELELEQAYLDFLVSRAVNFRAGMLLMPVGIINERHEPPVYNGVERPFVDTFIIPTTWFDAGVGVHGDLGHGLRYRGYVVAPLNSLEFTRGGRYQGQHCSTVRTQMFEMSRTPDDSNTWAFVASRWERVYGPASRASSFRVCNTAVTVGDLDARYRRDRLELRAQFAQVRIS